MLDLARWDWSRHWPYLAGALVVLASAVLVERARRRAVAERARVAALPEEARKALENDRTATRDRRGRRVEDLLTAAVAAAAAGLSAAQLGKFGRDVMGLHGPWAYLPFVALDFAAVVCALRARRRAARGAAAGLSGALVWVLALLSASMSASEGANVGEAFALGIWAPIAAVLWELGLAEERHARTERADRRVGWIRWLHPIERVLVLAELAADEYLGAADATERVRERRAARALYRLRQATEARAVARVDGTGRSTTRPRRGLDRRYRRAEAFAQRTAARVRLADAEVEAAVLPQLRVLVDVGRLANMTWPTPDATAPTHHRDGRPHPGTTPPEGGTPLSTLTRRVAGVAVSTPAGPASTTHAATVPGPRHAEHLDHHPALGMRNADGPTPTSPAAVGDPSRAPRPPSPASDTPAAAPGRPATESPTRVATSRPAATAPMPTTKPAPRIPHPHPAAPLAPTGSATPGATGTMEHPDGSSHTPLPASSGSGDADGRHGGSQAASSEADVPYPGGPSVRAAVDVGEWDGVEPLASLDGGDGEGRYADGAYRGRQAVSLEAEVSYPGASSGLGAPNGRAEVGRLPALDEGVAAPPPDEPSFRAGEPEVSWDGAAAVRGMAAGLPGPADRDPGAAMIATDTGALRVGNATGSPESPERTADRRTVAGGAVVAPREAVAASSGGGGTRHDGSRGAGGRRHVADRAVAGATNPPRDVRPESSGRAGAHRQTTGAWPDDADPDPDPAARIAASHPDPTRVDAHRAPDAPTTAPDTEGPLRSRAAATDLSPVGTDDGRPADAARTGGVGAYRQDGAGSWVDGDLHQPPTADVRWQEDPHHPGPGASPNPTPTDAVPRYAPKSIAPPGPTGPNSDPSSRQAPKPDATPRASNRPVDSPSGAQSNRPVDPPSDAQSDRPVDPPSDAQSDRPVDPPSIDVVAETPRAAAPIDHDHDHDIPNQGRRADGSALTSAARRDHRVLALVSRLAAETDLTVEEVRHRLDVSERTAERLLQQAHEELTARRAQAEDPDLADAGL
ncbi:hypothetical protein ACFXHK_03365 [Embleya sp. NPDC059267]|uniref:hypothetical protein n=1 Tax=Embleya sp. NPDC059267 TaxID=3346798 RepID=UPI0036810026